jgi:hypothetical protein
MLLRAFGRGRKKYLISKNCRSSTLNHPSPILVENFFYLKIHTKVSRGLDRATSFTIIQLPSDRAYTNIGIVILG